MIYIKLDFDSGDREKKKIIAKNNCTSPRIEEPLLVIYNAVEMELF